MNSYWQRQAVDENFIVRNCIEIRVNEQQQTNIAIQTKSCWLRKAKNKTCKERIFF